MKAAGPWHLSGSVGLSSEMGSRGALTGGIGLRRLYPMTLGELNQREIQVNDKGPLLKNLDPVRFSVEELSAQMNLGGLPVPAFIRDEAVRAHYWDNWLDTTLVRDAQRSYGVGFDPE